MHIYRRFGKLQNVVSVLTLTIFIAMLFTHARILLELQSKLWSINFFEKIPIKITAITFLDSLIIISIIAIHFMKTTFLSIVNYLAPFFLVFCFAIPYVLLNESEYPTYAKIFDDFINNPESDPALINKVYSILDTKFEENITESFSNYLNSKIYPLFRSHCLIVLAFAVSIVTTSTIWFIKYKMKAFERKREINLPYKRRQLKHELKPAVIAPPVNIDEFEY